MSHRQPWNGHAICPPGGVRRPMQSCVAAVRAHVVERLHRAVTLAHDDDRLVADLVLDPVAGSRDLLQAARHLPDMRPQVLLLELEELAVEIALTWYVQGAAHCEWEVRADGGWALVGHGHGGNLQPRSPG